MAPSAVDQGGMPPLYRVTNAETVNTVFYRRLLKRSVEGLRPARAVSALAPRRGTVGPGSTTTSSSAYIQGLINQRLFMDVTGQNVSFTAGFIGTDIARNAISDAPAATMENLALFIQAMSESASRKQGLARIHEDIARDAQHAVINAFEARFGGADHYRAGQNRLSGKLSPTLRRSDLILATRDGIQYMNRAALDRGAAHWYRLNFGAQPAGRQRDAAPYTIRFDGQSLGVLSLAANRPSRSFKIPRGIWLAGSRPVAPGGRGTAQFYTVKWFYQNVNTFSPKTFKEGFTELAEGSRKRAKRNIGTVPWMNPKVTRGIRGAHFFDAGVKVIARELPLQYSGLLLAWQKESSVSGTGPVAKVIARPQ